MKAARIVNVALVFLLAAVLALVLAVLVNETAGPAPTAPPQPTAMPLTVPPTVQPTLQPGPAPMFDRRTETALMLLSQSRTGYQLVAFVYSAPITIVVEWTELQPVELDGQQYDLVGMVAREGEILMNEDLADPDDPAAGDNELIEMAGYLAHVIFGDFTSPEPPYGAGATESLAIVVEAKVVAELIAYVTETDVDYYAVLPYYDRHPCAIPDQPWLLAVELDAMGIEPVDAETAWRILWLPEPEGVLDPAPTALELTEQVTQSLGIR